MNFWILPAILAVLLSTTTATISCPDGFTLTSNQQKCLKIFTNKKTHLDASTQCTSYGGTLANIKNAIDNRAIASFAANSGLSNIWIGIFCYLKQEMSCFHDDYTGVVTYNSFANGFPKEDFAFGQCVYMKTTGGSAGQWETNKCGNETLPFVCEVPVTVEGEFSFDLDYLKIGLDPTCKYNYGGYCYLPSQDIPDSLDSTTFDKAQAICTAHNSNLVSIHSKREVDFIKSIYKGANVQSITLGAQGVPSQPHVFKWVDGHAWDYNYRNPFDDPLWPDTCMQMELSEYGYEGEMLYGLWSEASCSAVSHFLCKRKIVGSFNEEALGKQESTKIHVNLDDPSHCNNTLLIAPGVVTSLGYGTTPLPGSYCTYSLATMGAYRVAIHFTDFKVWSTVEVLDQYGNSVVKKSGNLLPFSVIVESNMAVISNDGTKDIGRGSRGFNAVVMP